MKYNVAVIGGGPSGMMAAGSARNDDARVVLIEKNDTLGIKLLISGKGRCNITNNTPDIKKLVEIYGKNGKFLFSALHRFGVNEIINFFETRGVQTKTERGNRVFPVSDRSRDVLNTLINYLKESKVKIKINSRVKDIIKKDDTIEKVILASGEEIFADNFIICTGGISYPETGSSGDGYNWLKKIGHTITKLSPALTPIIVKEKFVKDLEGLSLKNVEISIYKNSKKIDSRFGEAIFTAVGISGPIILDMSKKINQELLSKINMQIDFKPALDFTTLDKRIQNDFQERSNKMFKNSFDDLLPKKLIPIIINLSKIDPNKKINLITKEERKKILHLLKEFELEITGVIGYKKAIVTAGGVSLNEIDPKTMKSKLISNLSFAGEILDIDGPTGGYNLQVCWSTGYVAGQSI